MLAMGSFKAAYARRGRIVNLIVGTGFTVYGLYPLLFLRGGAGYGNGPQAPGYGSAPQPPAYGEGAVPPAYGNAPYGQPQQPPPYQGGSWS
jgi:hypothetical protein